jgi:hypothetical protein
LRSKLSAKGAAVANLIAARLGEQRRELRSNVAGGGLFFRLFLLAEQKK